MIVPIMMLCCRYIGGASLLGFDRDMFVQYLTYDRGALSDTTIPQLSFVKLFPTHQYNLLYD
jgi:hypothetical protein